MLICGTAGCGKTMLAMEFLVRSATQFGKPSVFMMFEENAAELTANVRSLDFDLEKLTAEKKLAQTEEVHFAIAQETLQEKTIHQNTDAMAQQRGGRAAVNP